MLAAIIICLVAAFVSNTQVECFAIQHKVTFDEDFSNEIPDFEIMDKYPGFNETDMGRMQIIFPGTKWCGTGNVATSDNDFGVNEAPDRCCKEHDHCPEFLDPGQSRYGLVNSASLSRLECSCEMKFYNCLKSAGTTAANNIGMLYFSFLVNTCYKEDHPIMTCYQNGFFHRRCASYELDTTKPKQWQFFDLPTFK